MTSLDKILNATVHRDSSGVWVLDGHDQFAYSDGRKSEQYLRCVLERARDVSDGSPELESAIEDWPSEYHLSPARSRLLSGFKFDRSASVLEVGCGCGAITRYLGESFDSVVAVEGSIARARLARLRTRDLDGVSIVCAPFQSVDFQGGFDAIFCIGVLEYSASFVQAMDPYDAVVRRLAGLLNPGGSLFIAIENQFGLKYLSGMNEDHLSKPYAGLEGYLERPNFVRTFGRQELKDRLVPYFADVTFYYPLPDYKLPTGVFAEDFLSSPDCGEVISQIMSRDYAKPRRLSWDESLVTLELSRNRMMPFFANSFLAVGSCDIATPRHWSFDQEAIFFSAERLRQFRAMTRVLLTGEGKRKAHKQLLHEPQRAGPSVTWIKADSDWQSGHSLQTALLRRSHEAGIDIATLFEPCAAWFKALNAVSLQREAMQWLPPQYVDAIWSNFYPDGDSGRFVDLEWEWHENIPVNVVVIRAIFMFLWRFSGTRGLGRHVHVRSGRAVVRDVAAAFGVRLSSEDFKRFIKFQAELDKCTRGTDSLLNRPYLWWFMYGRPMLFKPSRLLDQLGARIRSLFH